MDATSYHDFNDEGHKKFMNTLDTTAVDYIISRYLPNDVVKIITSYRISLPKYADITYMDNYTISTFIFWKYVDVQGDYLYLQVCGPHKGVLIYLEDIKESADLSSLRNTGSMSYKTGDLSYKQLIHNGNVIFKELEGLNNIIEFCHKYII